MLHAGILWFAASALAAPAAVPSCVEQPGPIVPIVTSFVASSGYGPTAVPTAGPGASTAHSSSIASLAVPSNYSSSLSGPSMSTATSNAPGTSLSSSPTSTFPKSTTPTLMYLQKINRGSIPYSGSLTDGCISVLLTPFLFAEEKYLDCGAQDPIVRFGRYFNFAVRNLTLRTGLMNGSYAFEVGYVSPAKRDISSDERSWVFFYGTNSPSTATKSQTSSSQTSTATAITNISLSVSPSTNVATSGIATPSATPSTTSNVSTIVTSSPAFTSSVLTGMSTVTLNTSAASSTQVSLTTTSSSKSSRPIVDVTTSPTSSFSSTFSSTPSATPTSTLSVVYTSSLASTYTTIVPTPSSSSITASTERPQTIYALSGIPSCVPMGSNIVVNWTSPVASGHLDWIGVYLAGRCANSVGGECPSGSNSYSYVAEGFTSGTVSIKSPRAGAGTYIAYYLLLDGYKITAISTSFTVAASCGGPTPKPTYSLSVQSCIKPNALITVKWASSLPAKSNDVIAVYVTGNCPDVMGQPCPPDSNAKTYVKLEGGLNSANGGYATVRAPAATGVYKIYYLPNDGYVINAISAPVTISNDCPDNYAIDSSAIPKCVTPGSMITFPWTATAPGANSMDWIGVYASGRCNGKSCPGGSNFWDRIDSTTVPNTATGGKLTIRIPSSAVTFPQPTTFNGYYLINDLYDIASVSSSFTIQSSCDGGNTNNSTSKPILQTEKPVITAGGFLKVSWTGVSTNDVDNWVVFSKDSDVASASNFQFDCWQFSYGDTYQLNKNATASGAVSLKAPAIPGNYTVWYCLNRSFNCPSSLTITVTKPQLTCLPAGKTASNIKHIITIISENHSFDSYFGRYCKAPFGSNATCNYGRDCCESYKPIPGLEPVLLNDYQNGAFDPNHSFEAENCEINGGAMDRFTSSGGCPGSNNQNFAIADGSVGSASQYWELASKYAMSDRFFQSAPGASSQGDMFFARGAFVFLDNSYAPDTSIGLQGTCSSWNCKSYNDPTIGELLQTCGVPMAFYQVAFPTAEDPTDDPFLYYNSLANATNARNIFKAFGQLSVDIASGNLPAVSYVKGGYHDSPFSGSGTGTTEHPGGGATISAGESLNAAIINQILSSDQYKDNTVIFLVPDESGGFRDSVKPPPRSAVDNKPYGPRTQFIAVGNLVKKNYISHIQTEPASLVRFIESNWFADAQPGHLQTRDAVAGSLGDLFDPALVGFAFP
ncbi:phosphoesterase family-domain-containing protein [Chytriomyces sp. MP71]|nr:phosphoesterase family-domain-containing protein [Chytriomyces sp. MP71]